MRAVLTLTALSAFATVLVACASDNQRATAPSTPTTSDADSQSAASTSSPSETRQSGDRQSQGQSRILVTIGDQSFAMTLDSSAASRDLVSQLPLTLEMRDHGSVEKIGRLPRPLSLDGQPPGADPDPADVGYYAPSNDLVLYYGDQSYYPGIVVLGRMDLQAAEKIGEMSTNFTATVTVLSS